MSTEIKEVKRRRVRRNWERELKELQMYCEACIKSFESLAKNVHEAPPQLVEGHLSAYRDVLSKLGGGR